MGYKKIYKDIEDENGSEQSDWNMGARFYDSLDEIKRNQRLLIFQQNYYEAVLQLIEEVDWVGQDIDQKKLVNLRSRADSLFHEVSKSGTSRSFMMNYIKLRRDLWDEEMKAGITRPKNSVDYTNTSITQINNR